MRRLAVEQILDPMQALATPRVSRSKRNRFIRFLIFVFSIIIPTAALVVELTAGFCGQVFFDPIPTPIHVVIIALVPLTTFLIGRKIAAQREVSRLLTALHGFSVGVALCYAILFVPVMPIAAMYTAFSFAALFLPAVLTILPFAPLFSFCCLSRYAAKISQRGSITRTARAIFYSGFIAAPLLIAGLEVPRVTARIGSELLVSGPENAQALSMMRLVASRTSLLRASYYGWITYGPSSDFLQWILSGGTFGRGGWFDTGWRSTAPSVEQAREIYYRVTGANFADEKRPKYLHGMFDRLGGDADQGGASVGGAVPEVRLASAALDGSIDATGAVSYLEWTLTFKNSDTQEHEARFELLLPEGAVVSRATLWINGEEREAAVGARAAVRAAYEAVVQRRRDPLLVTTIGINRALIQCFPVPSNGREIKIKIGITAPVALASWESGRLELPIIAAKNFTISSEVKNAVWMESKGSISGVPELIEETTATAHAVRGQLPFLSATAKRPALLVTRETASKEVWSNDISPDADSAVRESFEQKEVPETKNFILVIDGSSPVEQLKRELVEGIRHIPVGTEMAMIVASDTPELLDVVSKPTSEVSIEARARQISEHLFSGGTDNGLALDAAWNLASRKPNTIILWVHGGIPIRFSSIEGLSQKYRRRKDGPKIISLPITAGPNRILETSDLQGFITERTDLLGDPGRLGLVVKELTSRHLEIVAQRERFTYQAGCCQGVARTSDHLARLLANDEINRLIATGARAAAVEKAAQYRLVTPVSGAVVLERASDYTQNGLTPPPEAGDAKANIPSVPEPAEWLVIICTVCVLLLLYRKRIGQRIMQGVSL